MNQIQADDIKKNNVDDLEMVQLTHKWLNLKHSLRKYERNWEPKSKKILNDLYAKYKDIIDIDNNIRLNDEDMKWISLHKCIIRKYVYELEKKYNYISFLSRRNTLNNHRGNKKNKWQSQQIKKKNIYNKKGFVLPNSTKYKHSKKQIAYKTKIKPNLKKKKRYSNKKYNNVLTKNNRYKNIYVYNKRRNRKKRINFSFIFDTKTCVLYNTLSYLLTFKIDTLLNKRICINNGEIEGKLTCISHSGQYRLEDVLYRNQQMMKYSYWFHINLTQTAYIIENHNNKKSDITNIFMDVMKFKLIQYFMFICSYKLDENKTAVPAQSPLKVLFLKNILNKNAEILYLTNQRLKQCKFIDKMLGHFCYGTKNNDFEYFDYLSKNFQKPKLRPQQLFCILCSYVAVSKDYIKNTNIIITNDKNTNTNDYMLWDELPIKKLVNNFTHNEYEHIKQGKQHQSSAVKKVQKRKDGKNINV